LVLKSANHGQKSFMILAPGGARRWRRGPRSTLSGTSGEISTHSNSGSGVFSCCQSCPGPNVI